MKILAIHSSPNPNSASRKALAGALADAGVEAWETLDTAAEPPPHYGADLMAALFAGSSEPEALRAKAVADSYIAKLMEADAVAISAPMHNFGLPSGLKAWMDNVARAGTTFAYGPQGPKGLLGGKKALIVAASGGDYSQGPMAQLEHSGTALSQFLRFLGMEPTLVWAAGQAGPQAEPNASEARSKAAAELASWKGSAARAA